MGENASITRDCKRSLVIKKMALCQVVLLAIKSIGEKVIL